MKKLLSITLLVFVIAISVVYFKTDTVKGLLKVESISTKFTVEKVEGISFESITVTKEQQAEIATYIENLKLKKIKNSSYDILDTVYRINWNASNTLYLVAPNIIVVPFKSTRGYRIVNDEQFLRYFEVLLK
ncbi:MULTISPECIES: hypothetical protein [Bacillales]|uniref:Uncharacterized protein n=1 Tax=Lysinibacillus louembei TaxID=1470088 RepID=A0ABZ0S1B1_9BACI|nr:MULTISPECIES: hypothetical protein [Bacillales]MCT6926025.1 hypothetical protein [Metasolibacillus sp.]MCT6942260.1 hypothetical protein [Metasolibacillus sp.]WPK12935.1 hypothetical protein R6U77_04380 [Lysinibacillus louembei]